MDAAAGRGWAAAGSAEGSAAAAEVDAAGSAGGWVAWAAGKTAAAAARRAMGGRGRRRLARVKRLVMGSPRRLSPLQPDAPVASSATAKHARARAERRRANDIASPRRRRARVVLPSPDV